jgi:hypothetical protein
MSESKPMPVTILDWRPMAKGSLLGFVKLRLGALEISDVTIHALNGKMWAGLPARPQIDKDGVAKREGGKIVYAKILGWTSRESGDRFSESVISALEAAYPGAVK